MLPNSSVVPKTTAADRVRAYLKKHDMTQRDLAAALKVTEAHLSSVLAGRDQPSLDMAALLEDITGIPARQFSRVA